MGSENKVVAEASSPADALARGSVIGRYVVLALVGRGGMGDVYAAYDPELDRKIAVKLLRTKSSAGTGASEGRTRLLREAQAIAKLSHPNVIVVYDVGTFEDAVFIAMEFIDGDTVRYWMHAANRDWRDVLRVFLPAGRGLAAAHEAGIVHRDFKPDNVMVGRDGKVRVMDFGLARQTESEGPAAPEGPPAGADGVVANPKEGVDLESTRPLATARTTPGQTPARKTPGSASARATGGIDTLASVRAFDTNLTETGAMLGTPAYMAAEQFASKAGDARTDQFSFCVALYESLYRERPFAGKSLMTLMAAVTRGEVRDPPAGSKVPTWIRKVLLRGLQPAADSRYASMNDILDALEKDPSAARRRWATVTLSALAVAAVATVASQSLGARRSPCEGGAAKLAGIWEPGSATSPRKTAIRAAFKATRKSYADRAFETVSRALDKYTADWTATYTDACEATSVRGEQSAEVLDLRMSCLQGRLESVKALTDVFARADGEAVEKAPSAAQALGPLERCSDLAILRAVVKPPDDPAVKAGVQALKPRLAEIKALTDAGHISEALARARPVVTEARRVGYLPVIAEALRRLAAVAVSQPAETEALYEEAAWAAQAGGDEELFAEAATMQVYVVGYVEGQRDRARVWSKVADATLRRLKGHDVLRSWLLSHQAALLSLDGKFSEAVTVARESLALKQRALGPDHPDVAQGLGNLADALERDGKLDEALEMNARALRIFEKTLGNDHPDVAMHLSTRGELLNALGRYAEAEAPAGRALEIWERAVGRDNPYIAFALTVLGRSCLGRGRAADAVGYLELAYRLRQRLDPEPSRLAETTFALAQALWQSREDRKRASTLATGAQALYARTPEKHNLETVGHWLTDHRIGI